MFSRRRCSDKPEVASDFRHSRRRLAAHNTLPLYRPQCRTGHFVSSVQCVATVGVAFLCAFQSARVQHCSNWLAGRIAARWLRLSMSALGTRRK